MIPLSFSTLLCKTWSLTEPEGHWSHQTICPAGLQLLNSGITRTCHHIWFLMWVLGSELSVASTFPAGLSLQLPQLRLVLQKGLQEFIIALLYVFFCVHSLDWENYITVIKYNFIEMSCMEVWCARKETVKNSKILHWKISVSVSNLLILKVILTPHGLLDLKTGILEKLNNFCNNFRPKPISLAFICAG